MIMLPESLKQYTDLYSVHKNEMSGIYPPLLNDLHARAAQELDESSGPRFRDAALLSECAPEKVFAPDCGVNLFRAESHVDVAASFRCDVPNISTLLGVVVNDMYHPTALMLKNLPQGVTVRSLAATAATDPAALEPYLNSLAGAAHSRAAMLNSLLLSDGIFIHVAEGVRLDKTIQIVNIFNSTAPTLTARRVVLVAGKDSAVRVLFCDHSQSPEVTHINSAVLEVYADKNSKVEVYDLEESSPATRRYWQLFARQESESSLTVNVNTLSGGLTHNEFVIETVGDNTETDLSGLAVTSAEQVVDTRVTLTHKGTHSHSSQLFKTALFDSSRGGFGGKVVVADGAFFTDAAQTNRNLLLDTNAHMVTAPQLEIWCDEVKCSHGATTGQLDDRAMFYMRSRGIPEEEARMMLTQAFMADVVERVPLDVLRERLHHLVEKRLSGAAASCAGCSSNCSLNQDENA